MTRWPVVFAYVVLVWMTGPVLAHHSSAGIDRTKSVTLEGTIKEFRWANPHSWIDIDVPDGKGGTATWSLEMTSPAFLLRAGWKSTTLKTGDKVSVTVRPLRNGDPGGLFVSVTLPDGRVMGERPAPAPGTTKP
jgi:hypothetical protein